MQRIATRGGKKRMEEKAELGEEKYWKSNIYLENSTDDRLSSSTHSSS